MCNSIFILVKRISLNVILLLSLLLDCGHMQIAFSWTVFSQLLNNTIIFIFRDIKSLTRTNWTADPKKHLHFRWTANLDKALIIRGWTTSAKMGCPGTGWRSKVKRGGQIHIFLLVANLVRLYLKCQIKFMSDLPGQIYRLLIVTVYES